MDNLDLDQMLDQVLESQGKSPTVYAYEPPTQNEAPKWPSGAARGIGKVSYTHDAMIDLLIANPTVSQTMLGVHFGYSPSWISQILSSDAFKSRLAERKAVLVDPTITQGAERQIEGLMFRSLEVMREKLDKPSKDIPDNFALRAVEITSRALGYGARAQVHIEQTNVENHFEKLADNLTGLFRKKRQESIEGDFSEITEDGKEANTG